MYFHMLYESDMLIVLDIDQEKLIELDIWNKDKTTILYTHKQKHPASKHSICSELKTKDALNSVLGEGFMAKLKDRNLF